MPHAQAGGFAAKTKGELMNKTLDTAQLGHVATELVRHATPFKESHPKAYEFIGKLAAKVREGKLTTFNQIELGAESMIRSENLALFDSVQANLAIEQTIGDIQQSAIRHGGGAGQRKRN